MQRFLLLSLMVVLAHVAAFAGEPWNLQLNAGDVYQWKSARTTFTDLVVDGVTEGTYQLRVISLQDTTYTVEITGPAEPEDTTLTNLPMHGAGAIQRFTLGRAGTIISDTCLRVPAVVQRLAKRQSWHQVAIDRYMTQLGAFTVGWVVHPPNRTIEITEGWSRRDTVTRQRPLYEVDSTGKFDSSMAGSFVFTGITTTSVHTVTDTSYVLQFNVANEEFTRSPFGQESFRMLDFNVTALIDRRTGLTLHKTVTRTTSNTGQPTRSEKTTMRME